ncbi:O-methyltransferase 1, chloroplastic [Aristolochia californica]|uniref:O-methyltransferase 1, chloroplastic n=1 Tax=Aristolochia californica TaxID=171875 RepID=UPI0035DB8994
MFKPRTPMGSQWHTLASSLGTSTLYPSSICDCSRRTKSRALSIRSKLGHDDEDPFLQAAVRAASWRSLETHRSDPLFHDPYARYFALEFQHKSMEESTNRFCLATKFIDDKLLTTMNEMEELRQVVLLTDGMDTRAYRVNWPRSTVIFDISPERVFKVASERLQGIGAKIPNSCLLLHVPLESSDIAGDLLQKGFSGNKPSLWMLQGLPMLTLESLTEILLVVSSLAMKGSILLGELPLSLAETDIGTEMWIEKLFLRNGFQVSLIAYEEVANKWGREPPLGDYGDVLFVAKQLRLSDDQMESWRREFQRMEEEADEEGFEEL